MNNLQIFLLFRYIFFSVFSFTISIQLKIYLCWRSFPQIVFRFFDLYFIFAIVNPFVLSFLLLRNDSQIFLLPLQYYSLAVSPLGSIIAFFSDSWILPSSSHAHSLLLFRSSTGIFQFIPYSVFFCLRFLFLIMKKKSLKFFPVSQNLPLSNR